MVKGRITTVLLATSLLLNVILAGIAGSLWLQRRAGSLGLSSSEEALRSLAGASVLPSVRIEFRVGEEQAGPDLTPVTTGDYPPTLYLHPEVAVSNGDIRGAKAAPDDVGLPAVSLELSESGSRRLQTVTSANLQKRLVILVDGKVLLAPVIQSPVTDATVQIAGALDEAEVQRIVLAFARR
jgi:preprotein translocase subunit SecD